MKRYAMAAFLAVICLPAQAESEQIVWPSIMREVHKLAELLRRNAELLDIEADSIQTVGLEAATSNGTIYRSTGMLVPFTMRGVDGGNLTQEYVALHRVQPVKLRSSDKAGMARELNASRLSLISFNQIDRNLWGAVDWSTASIESGILTATAHAYGCVKHRCCFDEQGSISIEFNGSTFGPNLRVVNNPNPLYSIERCPLPLTPQPGLPPTPK